MTLCFPCDPPTISPVTPCFLCGVTSHVAPKEPPQPQDTPSQERCDVPFPLRAKPWLCGRGLVTSCIGHWENTGSMSSAGLPMGPDTIQTSHSLILAPASSEKLGTRRSCQANRGGCSFPKISLPPKYLTFYHWQQALSAGFCDMTGSHCSFGSRAASSQRLNYHVCGPALLLSGAGVRGGFL